MPSFQLVIRLKSQNMNETSSLMNSDTLICIWILVFPIGIIQVSTPRKWIISLYFSSLQNYWPSGTLNSLLHNSLGELERCEKRVLQLLKKIKIKISWNINPSAWQSFYWQLCLRVCRIIFVITWWEHKRQTFTLILIKIMWILKYFVFT